MPQIQELGAVGPKVIQRRILTYVALALVLGAGFIALRHVDWKGGVQLHTIMEIVATLIASITGVLALVRFYSKRNNTILFIGVAFIGTAFLDGYHAVVTSVAFKDLFPSTLPSLIPWSWVASRLFLSVLLWLSWLAWKREREFGAAGAIGEKGVYALVGLLTCFSFLFFAFVPLPAAYYPDLFFNRPEEFVPAVFFLLALAGYVHKGHWKYDAFEHWVVLCLIVNFVGQAAFMSLSGQLFDMMFDAAHTLKKLSYVCVMTGLMISMFHLFRHEAEATRALKQETARVQLQNAVATAANTSLTVKEMMQFCVDAICSHTGWPVGHVYAVSEGSQPELAPTTIWSIPDPQRFESLLRATESKRFVIGEGLPGRVLEGGEPVWIADLLQDSNFPRAKIARDLGVFSAFAVPIKVGGEITAVMEFFSDRRVERDETLLGVAAHVGMQLGHVVERKQAEQALLESSATIREILKTAADGIISVDMKGNIETLNPAAEKMFGYADDVLIGTNISTLMPEFGQFDAVAANESPLQNFEVSIATTERQTYGQRKDGSVVSVEVSISDLGGNEDDSKFTMIVRDISKRKNAEQALKVTNARLNFQTKELEDSNKELDEFAYIASHDLKEPLRGIHNYSKFLIEDYADKLDDEGHKKLLTLTNLTKRMEALIDDLLTYSRVGRTKQNIVATDMDGLVGEIIDSLKFSLEEKNIDLRRPEPLPTVTCDRVRIGEVIRNLITNATKYNDKDKKWIEIGWRQNNDLVASDDDSGGTEDTAVFYVRDNGIGIREKHLETVFQIFKRLHGRDKFGGGTGAGLSIVKKTVERLGGKIWVESVLGEGSTFYFTVGNG